MYFTSFIIGIILLYIILGFKKPHNFPPGPIKLPIVGYFPYTISQQVHKITKTLSKDYGPIAGIFVGEEPTIIANSFEAVKQILSNEDCQGRRSSQLVRSRTWGETMGILFGQGPSWQNQKRFCLHQFRNLGFGKKSHENIVLDDIQDLIDDISKTKKPFELQELLGVSSINVLWAVMGGTRFKRNEPILRNLISKITLLFNSGTILVGFGSTFPNVAYFFSKLSGFDTFLDGFNEVRDFIQISVEEHKKTFDENNIRDLFDAYILELKNTNDKTFTEQQLIATSMDIFAAGVDTTSSLETFCIMYMCMYPEIQEKAQKEIDEVVGNDRLVRMDDRVKLVYTDAVYHEVFRMRGPAPMGVPHLAVRDTKIMGYSIPKGTRIGLNIYSLMMDSTYWGDPEVFRPERFIVDGKLKREERFLQFGKGKRVCLGESLAKMTTFLTFCGLIQNFKFTSEKPISKEESEGNLCFTLSPPNFKVIVEKRH